MSNRECLMLFVICVDLPDVNMLTYRLAISNKATRNYVGRLAQLLSAR